VCGYQDVLTSAQEAALGHEWKGEDLANVAPHKSP
jgi:hypothetical protein